jgi:CheY-like chemotaxis protein
MNPTASNNADSLEPQARTVLLIGDEPGVRLLAARVLRQLGYTMLEAEDGRDALRVAGTHSGATTTARYLPRGVPCNPSR